MCKYADAIKLAVELGYIELGSGRNRRGFDMLNGEVLKIPRNEQGESDNWIEHYKYMTTPQDLAEFRPAECQPFEFAGLPCLIMEKLDTNLQLSEMPLWADYVDCRQVGRAIDGTIKAYDFGN